MENDDVKEPFDQPENIDDIIQDEIQKAADRAPFKMSSEVARQNEAVNKIYTLILERIKGEPLPYYFHAADQELLVGIIKRTGLDNFHAHSVFTYLEMMLKDVLDKQPVDSEHLTLLSVAIDTVNSIGVRYFEEYLFEELKGVHIAEIPQRTKATLARLDKSDEKFFRQAVESVKKDAERRIQLRIEEKSNREQMYEPEEERSEMFSLEDQEVQDTALDS